MYPKEVPPLGEQHLPVARAPDLPGRARHGFGRHELALLDVDRLPGGADLEEEARLLAEESRDLEDIEDLLRRVHILFPVDVREDRDAHLGLDPAQDPEPLFAPGTAVGLLGAPVVLLVRGFKNIRDAQSGTDPLHLPGHFEGDPLVLQDAGPGDQGQRASRADTKLSDPDVFHHFLRMRLTRQARELFFLLHYSERQHRSTYSFRDRAKFSRILIPFAWLFSGWNWVAKTFSFQTADTKGSPKEVRHATQAGSSGAT